MNALNFTYNNKSSTTEKLFFFGGEAIEKRDTADFFYVMNNHLGNVLTTVTDRKIPHNNAGTIDYYNADISSTADYYAFGMQMPGRNFSSDKYRLGFNGQEKTDEMNGSSNHYEFKFREYDPRRGQFWSVDPLFKDYPWNSTFAFAENRVIDGIDLEGLEYSNKSDQGGTYGPLNEEQAKKTGATLGDGFKTETQIKGEETQKNFKQIAQKSIEFQKANNITPQNQGVIKPPEIHADAQMAQQIGQGIYIGLANEGMGQVIGLGLKGVGLGIKALGNLEVPLYRTFGGTGVKPSVALGKFYTPINPKLYGSKYARFAGLPEWNASTFTVKTRTTLSNLDFGSFGFAKSFGSNTGRFVPEIRVLDADAVKVVNFRVNEFANPTYTPVLPVKLPGQ